MTRVGSQRHSKYFVILMIVINLNYASGHQEDTRDKYSKQDMCGSRGK